MKTLICVMVIVAILLVQMLNGYALCETELYTPVFTFKLISVITVIGILGAIVWRLLI